MKNRVLFTCLLLMILSLSSNAQGTWTKKADFGGKEREAATGFSVGGKGYIGTGYDRATNTILKDFWEYDPLTDKWTKKADFPGGARLDAVAFSIGDKGYIGGGGQDYYEPYFKDLWQYNPANDEWTRKADLPGVARHMAIAFTIENKGYYGTGETTSPHVWYKDFWEYDAAADKWTQKADYGGDPSTNVSCFAIGDKGYIGTGYSANRGWVKDFWEYSTTTDTWTRKADFGGSAREYAAGLSIGNKGYIGTGYPPNLSDFWEYDPAANTWTRKADVGGPARAYTVAFSIGSKGYMGTGAIGTTNLKDFWEYTTETIVCLPPSSLVVVKVTDSTAKVSWTLPASAVEGLVIRYGAVGSSVSTNKVVRLISSSATLKGLLPNTNYRWKLSSLCADSVLTWVAGTNFTTTGSGVATSSSDLNITINKEMLIRPNPNKGNFTIQLHLPEAQVATMFMLYNNLGTKVWQQDAGKIGGALHRNIVLTNELANGIYQFVIQRTDVRLMQKIVIRK